jgi:hypothetical protein
MDERRTGPRANVIRDQTFAALVSYGLLKPVKNHRPNATCGRDARTTMLGMELLKVIAEKNRDFRPFYQAYAKEKAVRKLTAAWVDEVITDGN